MSHKTNFIRAPKNSIDETIALDEICHYLVSIDSYLTVDEAKADAKDRVKYFETLGLYKEDPALLSASLQRKSVHALIYAHNLHELIEKNDGYLPDINDISGSYSAPPGSVSSLVDYRRWNGLSREEIIAKLELEGMTKDQAYSFYFEEKSKVRNKGFLIFLIILIVMFVYSIY